MREDFWEQRDQEQDRRDGDSGAARVLDQPEGIVLKHALLNTPFRPKSTRRLVRRRNLAGRPYCGAGIYLRILWMRSASRASWVAMFSSCHFSNLPYCSLTGLPVRSQGKDRSMMDRRNTSSLARS